MKTIAKKTMTRSDSVYAFTVELELRETEKGPELSVTGELRKNGRLFSCGQLHEELARYFPELAWLQAHHLNGMRPGCEHQRAEGWGSRPIDPSKPLDAYGTHFPGQRGPSWNMLGWVRPDEHPEGLLGKACPTCGYKYGTAWLYEPLPPEVYAVMGVEAPAEVRS